MRPPPPLLLPLQPRPPHPPPSPLASFGFLFDYSLRNNTASSEKNLIDDQLLPSLSLRSSE
eukprot:scaffold5253_cov238-Skeletonema_dohrnii-CCMP3373.AAC.3